MSTQEVLQDKFFHLNSCLVNTVGNYTAGQLFNPVGSGIVCAVHLIKNWTNPPSEINVLRSTYELPVLSGPRNSMYWKTGGPASSKTDYRFANNTTVRPGGNNIWVLNANAPSEWPEPFVFGEGESILFFPDTTIGYIWCVSAVFEEIVP